MSGQSVYAVNCEKCSYIVEVINPLLGHEPYEVYATSFGLTLSDKDKIVRTSCPNCGSQVWAKFRYP